MLRNKFRTVLALAAIAMVSLVSNSANADLIISGDFTSHGGTTASISTTGNITAGTGVSSLGASILPFADGSANAFETVGDSANYAVVDQRPDGVTTSNYFTFDFTTSAPLVITSVSADINRIRASGFIHAADTMGNGSFDIYQGAALVGSLSTVYGSLGGGADKTVSYTGTAINLSAGTTYSVQFASLAGGAPGTVGFKSFDVTAVPEPTSAALFGLALAGLGFRRRR
jgi:hypothetical protein